MHLQWVKEVKEKCAKLFIAGISWNVQACQLQLKAAHWIVMGILKNNPALMKSCVEEPYKNTSKTTELPGQKWLSSHCNKHRHTAWWHHVCAVHTDWVRSSSMSCCMSVFIHIATAESIEENLYLHLLLLQLQKVLCNYATSTIYK